MTKLELFGPMNQQYFWIQKGKASEQRNTTFMSWGCFAFVGRGNLDFIKDIMDSLNYQDILTNIVLPPVQRLKLEGQ